MLAAVAVVPGRERELEMKWILIIIVWYGGGVDHIEFKSQKACEDASIVVAQMARVAAVCVPEGEW